MPGIKDDLAGKRLGKLTVIRLEGFNEQRRALWLCSCECGLKKIVTGTKLRLGVVRSCGRVGCKIGTSHGLSKKSKAYNSWKSMLARCRDPKHENFKRYGMNGITVAEEWQKFERFFMDMGEPPPGHVLDRIDNLKGYSKANCRWATYAKSTENRRNTIWLGSARVNEIAEKYRIPASRIYHRLKLGRTLAEIVNNPGRMNGCNGRHSIDKTSPDFISLIVEDVPTP